MFPAIKSIRLLPLLLLAGCMPSFQVPTTGPIPVAWKNAGRFPTAQPTRDLDRWWRSFDDPTLSRVIRAGLDGSSDIASALARVKEARANRKATAAALLPTLSGSAGASSSFTDRDGAARTTGQSYSTGLSASWEADLYGRTRSNIVAASANLGAAEENLNSVRASLAAEIAVAYVSLRANESRLEVLRRNIELQTETYQFTDWRLQAGEADQFEAGQAETSLVQSKAAIPALQQSIAQGKNLLARLCGRAPGGLDTLLAGSPDIPDPATRLAVGIPADTLRQRPDVRIAGYSLLAAVANTRAAEAERFPSLSLSGSLGLSSVSSGKIFNPEAVSGSILAGLAGPIFDAGRIRASIDASNARVDQSLEAYRSTVLLALSEVEDALIACRRIAERLAQLEKATRLARETDKLARQRYEAGEIDFLSVLDSQRTLLGLEDTLTSTHADRTVAYIRLYQALGGGY
ncbi:efflux transporter outer membrane subunit [Haloferula sargassicola]|uniref:Toluene efflux pump outer membrane protein TtgI n=1 Tax=Haloferula sargassicola TaxID=490096 RepID=A0ABP9UW19_9BACT